MRPSTFFRGYFFFARRHVFVVRGREEVYARRPLGFSDPEQNSVLPEVIGTALFPISKLMEITLGSCTQYADTPEIVKEVYMNT